jgi:hypothetical protein
MAEALRHIPGQEPPLARPGAWAGFWRRMGVKAARAVRAG